MRRSQPRDAEEPAERRRSDIAEQVTAGRSDHVGEPNALFRRSGKDRQAHRALCQVERNRRGAQTPAESGSDYQYDEGLHGHRHGIEWHLQLGRKPKRQRSGDCQGDIA